MRDVRDVTGLIGTAKKRDSLANRARARKKTG
jgi:hypothetical protein